MENKNLPSTVTDSVVKRRSKKKAEELRKGQIPADVKEKDQNPILADSGAAAITGTAQDISAGTVDMSSFVKSASLGQSEAVVKTQIMEHDLGEEKKKQKKRKRKEGLLDILKIFKYSKKHNKLFYLAIVVDILTTFLDLCIPIFMGFAIDCIVGPGAVDFNGIMNNVVILGVIVAVSAVLKCFEDYLVQVFCYRTSMVVRSKVFDKFNSVPLSVIDNHQHGDLLTRMVIDVEVMTAGFLDGIASLLSGIVMLVGTVVFMLVLNVNMALIIIAITPMSLLLTMFIAKKIKRYWTKVAKAQGDLSGHIEEYISSQGIVKSFSYENEAESSFKKINQDFYVVSEKADFLGFSIPPITRFVNGLVYGLVGLFGAIFYLNGSLATIGIIATFISYSSSFGKPFAEISEQISSIQEALASARRVYEVIEKKDEPSDEKHPELEECDGSLSIKNVFFSYVPSQKLIQNFSLDVKPGQKVAIVGPTGCGKSTMINLLMRFYDVTSGSIEMSGKNINNIKRNSLRKKYGMVLQESWLFAGTISENIKYGKPDATHEEIVEAAKLAGVHDFIMKMKDGYESSVEDGGSNISSGQKQLICIARIMLIKPPMLILDEATSNIDTNTEQKIQAAFGTMMEGRTSFVIAHRLSTIIDSDMILVMNKGNVIEKGTHKELMEKNGFYAHLYNSQFE